MSATVTTLLETPAGYRSREVARFMWQLDEQRRQLIDGTRGLTPPDLCWQPAPGMNTIGMLLAHIAFAEVHVVQVAIVGEVRGHAEDVVGITEADEGMPLAAGAPPSPALHGKPLSYFDELLVRAREHTRQVCRGVDDGGLDRAITRPPRPDGTVRVFNPGWGLYHLLEHEAGHRGQILLLKHLRSVTAPAG